jgi:microcystin degradation protein MlrC
MRVAIGELLQETDSFSPLRAGMAEFENCGLYRGAEILERTRNAGMVAGFLEVTAAQREKVELVPLLRAWAAAGGPIADDTFQQLRRELLERLRQAGPVDAVFLSLHGAAATESEDDVEGVVLTDVRQLVGDRVPIVVPLDHHGNITRRMVANADLLVGHETQPHDTVGTGRKAARLLYPLLAREIAPTIAWQKIPMITPQDQFLTSAGPMKTWFDRAREWERQPKVLDVSLYPMQPWLDVAEGGWAVVAHTDGDVALARRVAADLASLAWRMRREFWASERVAPAEAVRQAAAVKDGLVILSDTGDSVYGGSPGDSTWLLGELLARQVPCLALVPLVDPQALAAAVSAGVPSSITLTVGGWCDRVFCRPVTLSGRVAAVSKGLTAEIPDRGIFHVGRTALIECGAVRVVLLEDRSFMINHPLLYMHLGVDVADARIVVVKTASNFQHFARWRKQLIRVDSPGTTQSDLTAFQWRRLPRPIDPFDEIKDWQPDPQVLPKTIHR